MLMIRQPSSMIIMPGQKRSDERTPPSPNAIAFGGVLIMNGIPKEADIATRIAVEGEGISAVASGMSIITDAVLLIREARTAVNMHTRKSPNVGSNASNGTLRENARIMPEVSNNFPSVIPPEMRISVDQSMRFSESLSRIRVKNNKALAQIEIIAAEIP